MKDIEYSRLTVIDERGLAIMDELGKLYQRIKSVKKDKDTSSENIESKILDKLNSIIEEF